jgi:prolyl oligopeptidase
MNRLSFYRLFIVVFFIESFFVVAQSQQLTYPPAKRVGQVDIYHGVKVADPYRWMEDDSSAELRAWIKSQEELQQNYVSKIAARSAIQKRISELVVYDSYTTATGFVTPFVAKRKSRYFFIKTSAGRSEPVLYVQESLEAEPKILLDAAARYKDEKINLEGYEPSPNGRFVVLYLSQNGARWLSLKVLDVETGKELSDVLTDVHRLGDNVAWTPDSKGFFYTKFAKIEQGAGQLPTNGNAKIYFHALGNPQTNDALIYERPDRAKTLFSYQVTADGKYLVISSVEGGSSQNQIFYKELADASSRVKPLLDKADANYTFLGSQGSLFWLYTNLEAPRGRVVKLDVAKPEQSNWKEIVPQAKEVISAGSSVGGNALGMFGNRLVLLYMRDSNPIIKVFDADGRFEKEIILPSGGTVWGGFSGSQYDPEVLYEFLGLTSPATFYRLDLNSKQNIIFLRPELKLNAGDYETRQVFFTSKDGVQVPMFLAHRKGIKLNGSNPALMYGYGALGWVAFIWYQPHVIAWLDAGGIYAVPGIRGGGEYGEEWHQAGVKQNKQNSIDDYIAAAEWLTKNKYTNPAKLAANGGSASSAVAAGAAILQRPELFGAAVIDIPILDMLRYDKFTNGRYWISEFGLANEPQEFKSLIAYSPYHNVKPGRCYPPTLVMIGEKDQVALPLHGYKFTAQMQHAQSCNNPVLMKIMWGAGHNFGATPEQRIDSWTDALSFLSETLKIDNFQPRK